MYLHVFLAALFVLAALIWFLFCPKSTAQDDVRRDPPRGASRNHTSRPQQAPLPFSPHMSRDQACSILGLSPVTSAAESKAAWNRLMRRMHPDTGGTDGMAMLLSEARDAMLRKAA